MKLLALLATCVTAVAGSEPDMIFVTHTNITLSPKGILAELKTEIVTNAQHIATITTDISPSLTKSSYSVINPFHTLNTLNTIHRYQYTIASNTIGVLRWKGVEHKIILESIPLTNWTADVVPNPVYFLNAN